MGYLDLFQRIINNTKNETNNENVADVKKQEEIKNFINIMQQKESR